MDTGNIDHTRRRTKTNKAQKHNTTEKTKKMSNTDPAKIQMYCLCQYIVDNYILNIKVI